MKNTLLRLIGLMLLAALLGGCATKQTSLYQWQGYQNNVDAYFRADKTSPDAQVQQMETDLQKITASGGAVPPGYYAHLGLLYGQQGRLDQFAEKIRAERKQYPESETFMDFLLRNFKK
ncbi:DUF4810 domain-containing protein [Rhodoferax lacus]|uniref:DUF4810 domain-containing protein n=1 Tax=Rhodoferax lacus TaxID=2184758 RepID=A0A3E1R7I3_9BURK|nr:DUF4810 domain-containing protein [Rhodoferax lacus]RFO95316.1 DUF4810 domain-containing protein [Rhodoferax lacus]